MGSLSRLFSVSKSIGSQFVSKPFRSQVLKNVSLQPVRSISTSKKKQDNPLDEPIATPPSHIMKQPFTPIKDWQSHGCDYEDELHDLNTYHLAVFLSFSGLLVTIMFYWSYFPDYLEVDWTQREAYLLVREREHAGLPYISPDYIDPALIHLPSDEELGDMEIVI